MKIVIVINGAGGVGKDTLISFAAEKYGVMNVSSIYPIKEAARQVGWNGKKDQRSRRFLSDLKKLSVEYNDYPATYLKKKYEEFMAGRAEIMFVAIREGSEIRRFIEEICPKAVTLLVRRPGIGSYGNSSDDDVENFGYDFVYNNEFPLTYARQDFMRFLKDLIITAALKGADGEQFPQAKGRG